MTSPDHSSVIPTNASISYPRAFLLSIYTAAIARGFVYITPVAQADYPSLKGQFYRLRRRADSSNKNFITQEHHLVSLGAWEPGPSGTGRVAAIFDKMPEGLTPSLEDVHGNPIDAPSPEFHEAPVVLPQPAAAPFPLSPGELTLDEGGIDDFVAQMLKKTKGTGDE